MSKNKRAFLLLLILLASFTSSGYRETSSGIYPEYVIEEGDFLSIVANRFSTSVNAILEINNIPNADSVLVGDRIKIPSLEGIAGTISTESVKIGDTIRNISIQSGMSEEKIIEINRITSPSEVYAGTTLMIIQNPSGNTYTSVDFFDPDQTLIEKSILNDTNPITLEKINQMEGSWDISDKQLVYANAGENVNSVIRSVSPLVDILEIKQLPLIQGETHVVHVRTANELSLSGGINGQTLRFFQDDTDPADWYAFFGIDALEETGLTDFAVTGTIPTGESFEFEQKVIIQARAFVNEVVQGVDESTLEDYSNQIDDQTLNTITQTSPIRSWGTMMSYPVDEPCMVSGFGNHRTYNNGTYTNYHSGVDYGVCTASNINIYAAADGEIVFAGLLPIHGGHTIIDHGWGVYSTYSHQSEIMVSAGQTVKRGDLIGLIGSTGRSVGPHLHWEIKINGVYVNPLTWLNTSFP